MSTEPIKIGAARVAQIEGILLADPVLKTKVGPKDRDVARRDGTSFIKFHRLSVDVAQRMLSENKDPLTANPAEVKDCARLILDEQAEEAALSGSQASEAPAAPAPAAPAPARAAAPETTETPAEPSPAAPASAPAPAAAPAPAPEAKKSKKKVAAPAPAPAAAPAPAPAAEAAPAPAAPAVVPSATVESAPVDSKKRDANVNVQLAVYSLISCAESLAERDQLPGAKERRALLTEVAAKYRDVVAH